MPLLAFKSKLLNPRQRLLIPKSCYNLTYTGHYIPYLYCRIGNHWPQVIHSPPISSKELGTSKRTTSPKSYILVKSKESIIFRVNIKVYTVYVFFPQYKWNNIWFALGDIAWNCHTCDYPSKTMVSTSQTCRTCDFSVNIPSFLPRALQLGRSRRAHKRGWALRCFVLHQLLQVTREGHWVQYPLVN